MMGAVNRIGVLAGLWLVACGNSEPTTYDARPCSTWTPESTHFRPCSIPVPLGALELGPGDYTYNTTDGTLTDPAGALVEHANELTVEIPSPAQGMPDAAPAEEYPYRVVSVDDLRIDAGTRLRTVGFDSLLVVSWHDIDIEGLVDAASHGSDFSDAGAGWGSSFFCSAGGNTHVVTVGHTGGGGGGGYQGPGGSGGIAGNGAQDGGLGGAAMPIPEHIQSGCAGGIGAPVVDAFGDGGRGGGSVEFVARGTLTVRGILTVGGAGGLGGQSNPNQGGGSGGGGGGAGGYIGLEAAQIVVSGTLAANGGGGGEGASATQSGRRGQDGRSGAVPADGGDLGTTCGTAGGDGGAGSSSAGGSVSEADSCGGGGGGGGVGYIILRAPTIETSGATISPAAIANP